MNGTFNNAIASKFASYERAASDAKELHKEFANSAAALFIPGMAYAPACAARDAFKADYRTLKPSVTDNALDQAFSRMITAMNDYLRTIDAETFAFPKAETKEATKKAEQRAKTEKAIKAEISKAKKAAGKDAAPDRVIQELAKVAGTSNVATKAIEAVKAEIKAKIKAENSEMIKAIRAELSNASVDVLKQIANLLHIKP